MLILKSLVVAEMHGLGISRRIQQITGGTFVVKPGSLFPALHRMEEEGWISSFWGDSENDRSREVLPFEQGWTEAARSRNRAMGPHYLGDRSSFGSIIERRLSCRTL